MKVFSDFKEAKFYDHNHSYFVNGNRMKSVTTVIKEYSNPFDTKYWSTYKAMQACTIKVKPINKDKGLIWGDKEVKHWSKWREIPLVQQKALELEEKWEDKGKHAREYGDSLHKYMENAVWGKYPEEPIAFLDEIVIDILDNYDPIRTEMIVYSEKYNIAGQIDLLARNKQGKLCILDYKTDEEISRSNMYDRFKFPVDHLEESDLNKYKLQLNTYRHLLELKGVTVEEMKIIRLREESEWIDIKRISVKELINDYHTKGVVYV